MANILANAAGDFHTPATWIGGVVPTVGDTAYANSRAITFTQNITCDKLSTMAENGATAGGSFATSTAGLTVTAAVGAGSTACLVSNVAFPGVLTVNASVGGIVGGTGASSFGVNNNSTGSITITGNVTSGSSGSGYGVNNASTGSITITGNATGGSSGSGYGVNNASTGSITITGNATGGSSGAGVNNNSTGTVTMTGNATGGSGGNGHGVNNNSTGSITITGNATGGSGGSAYGVNNASTGSITITGNVTGGSIASLFGAYNNSGGSITIVGIVYATATTAGARNFSNGILRVVRAVGNDHGPSAVSTSDVPAVDSASVGSLTYVEQLEFGLRGNTPVKGPILLTGNSGNVANFLLEGGGRKTLVDPNSIAGALPAVSDVRSGVVYNLGVLTGTCAVPAAGSVTLGTPVDNTTGTAVLTAANVRDAVGMASANLDTQLGGLSSNQTTINNNVLSRLAATAYTAPPSAAANASAVRTELNTELGRIDATVSSRLASAGYTAPPSVGDIAAAVWAAGTRTLTTAIDNSATIAAAVWSAVTRTITGGTVDTLTNAPDVPTESEIAAAVWGQPTRTITGGTVDTLTNSPNVPTEAEIAAEVRSELAPELARVANCATVATTGQQIQDALTAPET